MADGLDRLWARHPVLWLDGATGTELERRGLATPLPLWTADAAVRAPGLLRQVHLDALLAGAQIVTANTFRTHPYTLRKVGRESDAAAWTQASVQVAREACRLASPDPGRRHEAVHDSPMPPGGSAANRGLVAGSIAPLEDCYHPERVPAPEVTRREHARQVRNLVDAGVDLVLIETMNTAREAHAAAEVALESGLPVWVSMILAPDASGDLLSGEDLEVAVARLRALDVQGRRIGAFLVNCAPPDTVDIGLERLGLARDDRPFGAYPNAGLPEPAARRLAGGLTPTAFAAWAVQAVTRGARILGGCCGTGPAHIRAGAKATAQAQPGSTS